MLCSSLLRISFRRQTCLLILLVMGLAVMLNSMDLIVAEGAMATLVQGTGKTPKPLVGSAMAVLATLDQAQVLPPENTPEANHIIKAVIQFQSAFTKSGDRAIHDFAARAMATKYGERSVELISEFQSAGWTSSVLEALADAELRATAEEMQALAAGFSQFNLSTTDFHRFMSLVREARNALEKRGLMFGQVYASHRQAMPGASALR